MTIARMAYGIPDVELERGDGTRINPGCFAGHILVVAFLPTDAAAEAEELKAWAARAEELFDHDAWLIAVRESAASTCADDQPSRALVRDPAGAAWTLFGDSLGKHAELDRALGAVFVFGRGGGLRRVWAGSGHTDEVMHDLGKAHFGTHVSSAGSAAP